MLMKKVWLLISWLHQKTADLDLHCFQKRVENFEKSCAGSALILVLIWYNKYRQVFKILGYILWY